MRLYFAGRVEDACVMIDGVAAAEAAPEWREYLANNAACIDVASGHYLRAMTRRAQFGLGATRSVLRVNEAEALMNMGRAEESLLWADQCRDAGPFERTGAALHCTWVLSRLGRVAEAREAFARADESALPADFRTEHHFSEAFLRLAEEDHAHARRCVDRGLAMAARVSSQRNALFLHGTIAADEGRHQEAIVWFEQGAAHAYRGQGGEALLAWGDCLAALDRAADARRAWGLVLERDPESSFATVARERLLLDDPLAAVLDRDAV